MARCQRMIDLDYCLEIAIIRLIGRDRVGSVSKPLQPPEFCFPLVVRLPCRTQRILNENKLNPNRSTSMGSSNF